MTSFTRTQVYLEPDDHRQLKRLAAARGHSMTTLVREAVARYVAEEVGDDLTAVDVIAELYDDPLYEGIAHGREGFVARMRARAESGGVPDGPLDPVDRELGEALASEHERQRRGWEQRDTVTPAGGRDRT
jgi:predicted DNA-binding protein